MVFMLHFLYCTVYGVQEMSRLPSVPSVGSAGTQTTL